MRYQGYVGTYTTDQSEGIYEFVFDQKGIMESKLFAKIKNPKYLCFVEDKIAAVCDFDNGSGIGVFDQQGNCISSCVFEHKTSCYIAYRNSCFYTTNFHEGTVSIVSYKDNQLKLEKQYKFQDKAGCHEILFYKDLLLVPCLNMDVIQVIHQDGTILEPIQFEPHAGCRHGVFSDDMKFLYIVGELSNCLYAVDLDTMKVVDKVKLVSDVDQKCSSAAIRKYKDDIFVSVRGANVISVVKAVGKDMKVKAMFNTVGDHPRDFYIEDDVLFIANRDSDSLNVFDLKKGYLNSYVGEQTIYEAVSVIARRS